MAAFRAKIAERFRRGKMYKARSGKIVGYNAPYGYRYNKESGETMADTKSLEKQLTGLENEQKRYVDAYGKGLLPEQLFAEKMRETTKQKESVEQELTKASQNRGNNVKINLEQLVQKATRKIGELTFEQKKFIIERVVDKIVASPQEITIWGHIPAPALATTEKVNHVSQYRYRRPTKRRQVYPV